MFRECHILETVTRELRQPGEQGCSPLSSRAYPRGNLHQNSKTLQGQLVWNPRDQAFTSLVVFNNEISYLHTEGPG